jgi:solute carrier family 40 (iron-regulated transporter), member 1
MIDGVSTAAAIWTTLIATLLSVVTEYVFIVRVRIASLDRVVRAVTDRLQVYEMVPNLRRRSGNDDAAVVLSDAENDSASEHDDGFDRPARKATGARLASVIRRIFPWSSVALYIRHPAFLPSFSYALAHLTVLSFSGRMIAFLLAVGYDSFGIGIARTVFTISELSATWISPRLAERMGTVWAGAWSLWWQTAWLSVGAGCFLVDWPNSGRSNSVAVSGLVVGVILSRIGLWGYALAVQNIVQDVSVH